jgi:hypothetical protein
MMRSIPYGPALTEAYEAEKKSAYYPRVILMGGLPDVVEQGRRFIDRDGALLGFNKTWRKCNFDGRTWTPPKTLAMRAGL